MPRSLPNQPWWRRWVNGCREAIDTHRLPSFFIIGPPRTGTSWLHEVLRHRTLLPSLTKETRFFDAYFDRGLRWYQAHYTLQRGTCPMGEVAPTYFACEKARQRIKEVLPHARIICIFRNPVERIFSLYRVKRAYGMIPWSFEEALALDPELIESSRYATHLSAWLKAFGAERVLPTLYDDLLESPQKYVDILADFLGISRFHLNAPQLRNVHSSGTMTHPRCYFRTRSATRVAEWLKARHCGPFVSAVKKSPVRKLFLGGGPSFADIPKQSRVMVQDLFQQEIDELEVMLQRDLSAWKYFRGVIPIKGVMDSEGPFRAIA